MNTLENLLKVISQTIADLVGVVDDLGETVKMQNELLQQNEVLQQQQEQLNLLRDRMLTLEKWAGIGMS